MTTETPEPEVSPAPTPEATPSTPAAAPTEKDARSKRLTPEEWLEIESHYEHGTMTGVEICAAFSISGQALHAHFKRKREAGSPIVRNSKRHLIAAKTAEAVSAAKAAEEAKAAAEKAALMFEEKRNKRIWDSKEDLFNARKFTRALTQQTYKKLADNDITIEAAQTAFKTIRLMNLSIKLDIENVHRILDIDNNVDVAALPELIFKDLSPSEIAEIQKEADEEGEIEYEHPDLGDDDIIEEAPK